MSEREYTPRPVEPPNAQVTSEYSRYSKVHLGLALWGNLTRAVAADFGHTMIEGWILGLQLVNWLLDEDERDEPINWTPDATGVSPTLDVWAEDGQRNIDAIRKELNQRRYPTLRRSQH